MSNFDMIYESCKNLKIVIHGGAGVISPHNTDIVLYIEALKQILSQAYRFVKNNSNNADLNIVSCVVLWIV